MLKLQADLEQLEIWAKDWGMRFNAKKCYILSINKKSNKFYSLDNHILQEVQDNQAVPSLLAVFGGLLLF
jgi:hypothetical protein